MPYLFVPARNPQHTLLQRYPHSKSILYPCRAGKIPTNVNNAAHPTLQSFFTSLPALTSPQFIPPLCLKKVCVCVCTLHSSCQSICILTPIRRTNHRGGHTHHQEFKGQLTGWRERKKNRECVQYLYNNTDILLCSVKVKEAVKISPSLSVSLSCSGSACRCHLFSLFPLPSSLPWFCSIYDFL